MLSDIMFLYIDLAITTVVAIFSEYHPLSSDNNNNNNNYYYYYYYYQGRISP